MKKNIFIGMVLFSCLMLFQSATVLIETKMNKPKEKILLEKATKTRSGTATEVNAYADGNMLTVNVLNYTGDVYVQVMGAEGATQTVFTAYNSGYGLLDISALPAGTYIVQVTLDDTYTGEFEK